MSEQVLAIASVQKSIVYTVCIGTVPYDQNFSITSEFIMQFYLLKVYSDNFCKMIERNF